MDFNSVETIRHWITSANRSSAPSISQKSASLTPKIKSSASSEGKIERDSVLLSKEVRERPEATVKSLKSDEFEKKLSVSGNKQVIMQLIDPETKDVVRQIPPEDLLRLKAAIRNAAEKL